MTHSGVGLHEYFRLSTYDWGRSLGIAAEIEIMLVEPLCALPGGIWLAT
jgi:hypothetical protein